MLREHGIPALEWPTLKAGLLHRGLGSEVTPPAGHLAPQGRVLFEGRSGRFDDVVARGWVLLTRRAIAPALLDGHAELIEALDITVVHVTPAIAAGAATDLDTDYDEWFAKHGVTSILVRPDFYIFGAARDPERDSGACSAPSRNSSPSVVPSQLRRPRRAERACRGR